MTSEDRHYAEVCELVFAQYERILDLEVVLTVVPLSDVERERMSKDPDFQARIALCDARVREDLMADFRGLSKNATSEAVRLTALKELGRTLYPKRFKEKLEGDFNVNAKVVIVDDVN